MKLQELGQHFDFQNKYYVIYEEDALERNLPRLYIKNGGSYEVVQWFEERYEGDSFSWNVCYVPLGINIYKVDDFEAVWNPVSKAFDLINPKFKKYSDFLDFPVKEFSMKEKLKEVWLASLSERERFVYQVARDCGLEIISA